MRVAGVHLTVQQELSPGATFWCAGCSSSPIGRRRLKGNVNSAKNAALRVRLRPFLTLALKGNEAEWFGLARDLGIDGAAIEALVTVVQAGRWRTSTAPTWYLKTNVSRLARDVEDPFDTDGRRRPHGRQVAFSELLSPDAPQSASAEDAALAAASPAGQLVAVSLDDRRMGKIWTEIREQAALLRPDEIPAANEALAQIQDVGVREVLCAKALGLTREEFLSDVCGSERKRRQAAWRRASRKGPPDALRTSLRRRSRGRVEASPEFEDRAWEERQSESIDDSTGCGGGYRIPPHSRSE